MGERTVISHISGRTDMGMVRTNNEDNLILADLKAGGSLPGYCQITYPVDDNALLLVVSDGVGGGAAGEGAGELTVLGIKDVLIVLPREKFAHERPFSAGEKAKKIIWTQNRPNPSENGM